MLVAELDREAERSRQALEQMPEGKAEWKLLVAGRVVQELPRHIVMRGALNHLAHHRGQMTVYLRLLRATVPAIYGPSADGKNFG